MKRIFLASAKDESADKVAEWKQEIEAQVPGVTVVDGLSDWNENFARCGGWNGWAEDVATGRDLNGRPRYDAILCPRESVGKATMQIVEAALRVGKPVLLGDAVRGTKRVVGVVQSDPTSWKAGWELVTDASMA
jgi:hypothetical protein